MRRLLLVLVLVLVVLALLVQRVGSPLRSSPPATTTVTVERIERIDRDEGGGAVRGVAPDGRAEFVYTLEDWRAWAEEHLEASLGGPVRIADQAMPPDTFHGFGAAALAPDGERLFLAAGTYAVLTTASVVGVLDVRSLDFEAVGEPALGDVGEVAWSPDGRYVAYTLDSARAHGDGLRVDDMRALEVVRSVAGEDLLEAAAARGLAVETDARAWLPEVEGLDWTGAAELTFTTADPVDEAAGATVRWRIDAHGAALRLEGATPR